MATEIRDTNDKVLHSIEDGSIKDAVLDALKNGIKLTNANLTCANLTSADLSYADLTCANLSYADLTCANLTRADLSCANLSYANLTNAKLTNAKLTSANLTRANLSCANLTGSDLSYADLTCANLSYADLTNADLTCAKLTSAKLTSADLSGATGLFSATDWMGKFESNIEGIIVYRRQRGQFDPPKDWIFKPGSILKEIPNPDRCTECGSGVSFGTLDWVKSNYSGPIWKCLIRWAWLCGVVVPFNTDCKARCERLELIEIVPE